MNHDEPEATNPNVCSGTITFDVGEWIPVIDIGENVAAGQYEFAREGGNSTPGNLFVTVDANGSVTSVSGNFGYVTGPEVASEANGSDWSWVVVETPAGGTASISGEGVDTASDCTSSPPPGTTVFGVATIQIGTALPGKTKPNDVKKGGNQCPFKIGGGSPEPPPMALYSAEAMLASLNIEDTPFRYTPPRGPVIDFTVTYNQREPLQAGTFSAPNLGPRWTFNWLSYVTDDPTNLSADASLYMRGGGTENYSGFDAGSGSYQPDAQSHAVLVRTSVSPITYERRMPDGSKQVYAQIDNLPSNPRKIYMTEVWDSTGTSANRVTINFDSPTSLLIDSITDALGYTTTFSYDVPNHPFRVHSVTGPSQFGTRAAFFAYNDNGQLTTITDQIGIQSIFTYYTDGTNLIQTLQTPYGTSCFHAGQGGNLGGTTKWVEMTDPQGGLEKVEYSDNSNINDADPSASVPAGFTNSGLAVANTFFWDKRATNVNDFSQARLIHWAKNTDETVSSIAASEKAPLENRVWYAYTGQTDTNHVGPSANPNQVARVLDDSSTQLWQYQYNSIGKVTQSIDPVNRVMSYGYDTNNIDLLTVRQTTGSSNELLRSLLYNALHEPLTDTDAAGQTTHYCYRSDGHGQIKSVKNALSETTTYGYGENGNPADFLTSITSPTFGSSSAVVTFDYATGSGVYNHADHPSTVTSSPDNYAVTTDYDNLDRPTQITYPDGTNEQFQYSQNFGNGLTTILDLTTSIDRRGRPTVRHYNGNRQMDSITDPLLQTTYYMWCNCGALTGITDPNGSGPDDPSHTTTFNRDLQSRVLSKVFPGGTEIDYTYENTTSRLKSVLDANGQTTNYQYYADDDLKQVTYTNAGGPTPTVTYVYDPNYNRVTSMSDGVGTTNYAYYTVSAGTLGAGKLHQVDGPFSNDTITYGYDELGRVVSQDINGTPSSVVYDSLGRLGTSDNALGHFSRLYEADVTPRLSQLNYPNGQTAKYVYFDNSNDRRLETLRNLVGSTNLSRHDYTYDPEGQIQTWNKTLEAVETDLSLGYDDARQLLSVAQPSIEFDYDYDAAGNRLDSSFSSRHIHGGNAYTANNLNQLDSVTRNPGVGPSFGPFPITYDANGNMTYDGNNQTFEWDAANRLVAINYIDSGNRTEFAYDGLGRRVKITEYGAVTTATIQPDSTAYNTYTSAPFTVPSGNYTLMFEGLNTNGGNNTALLDSVTLNSVPVSNGSFESPTVDVGIFQTDPTDTAWKYIGTAGISANGSSLTSSNGPAPDGSQVGFVQNNGDVWQTLTLSSGTYSLSFQAAQSGSANDTYQQLIVSVRGAPVSVQTFVWSGNTIAEERDATGANVMKRFFAEGEQRIGGSDAGLYYYSRDHLGSIREVTDSSGNLVGQFDYDPWGNEVVVAGNMNIEFGFTGHYFHQPSGLNLSLYRAYNPTLGRWISRDPLKDAEKSQGPNLYSYVRNDSINLLDPLGLFTQAELDAAHQIALSGLLLRRQQLVALENGDIAQWQELQCQAVPEGNAEGPTYRNPAVDAWEAGEESQGNASQNNGSLGAAMWSGILFGDAEFNSLLTRTENEAMRQILLFRWLNGQTADH